VHLVLAKQCLLGVGNDPFAFRVFSCNGGSNMSFDGNSWFLRFWASLLTVFKSFIPFSTFYFKNKALQHTQAVFTDASDG
jgi:hypothetical protein